MVTGTGEAWGFFLEAMKTDGDDGCTTVIVLNVAQLYILKRTNFMLCDVASVKIHAHRNRSAMLVSIQLYHHVI